VGSNLAISIVGKMNRYLENDFTQVYNSPENNYRSTPPIVKDAGAEFFPDCPLTSGCVLTESADSLGQVRAQYEVGLSKTFDPVNEPPVVAGDFSYLLDFMSAFKRGNFVEAGAHVRRLFSTEPKVVAPKKNHYRGIVSRAETNAEKCFFDVVDLERVAIDNKMSRLAFLNPNKGTIKRYAEFFRPVDVYITDHDLDYVRSIQLICVDVGWSSPYVVKLDELPKDYLYYSSFNGGQEYLRGLSYVSFIPDLVSMKLAGVKIVHASDGDDYFEFMRGADVVSVLRDDAVYQYKCDVLTSTFNNSSKYVSSQGLMHGLVSTVDLKFYPKIIAAAPYPLALEFTHSERVCTRVDQVRGPWEEVTTQSPIPSRYVRGKYYGNIYDLGKYFFATEVDSGTSNAWAYRDKYYVCDDMGDVMFRESKFGECKMHGRCWKRDVGVPVVDTIASLMQFDLSGMSIYRYDNHYSDSVRISLLDMSDVGGLDTDEMRDFVIGYNNGELSEGSEILTIVDKSKEKPGGG
jgi:hypothetical protein